jgi:hypothetical protein
VSFTPYTINPDLDLELIREVPVPPEAVFAAWTDPESLKEWFAPRPYSITRCEIDLRPGGGFRTAMNSPWWSTSERRTQAPAEPPRARRSATQPAWQSGLQRPTG